MHFSILVEVVILISYCIKIMNLQSHHVLIILIQITNHHDMIMMTSGIIKPYNSEFQISRLPMRCSGRPCLTDLHGRCWTSTPGKLLSSYLLLSLLCHLYRKYCYMFLSLRVSLWDVSATNERTNKQKKPCSSSPVDSWTLARHAVLII
jgi:hypothetical protein